MTAPGSVFLAIDLGGTRLRVATGDGAGGLLARHAEAVPPDPGTEALADAMAAAAARLFDGRKAVAAGVACPGLIDAGAGVVMAARNLGWRDVPLARMLSERLGCPVVLENDANLAALGEAAFGAGKGCRDIAFLGVGTGVGAGLVLDGRLHRGARFAAGEVGRLTSGVRDDGGVELGVEDVASGPAVLRRARLAGVAAESTAGVFALARDGDERAAAVIGEAARALAFAVFSIVAIADPEVVIVGGGVAQQGDALLGPLRDAAYRLGVLTPLVPAALGADSQLYGALRAAIDA
jgi:predicted NBD/HSP70 family sugar kinase